VTLIHKTAVIHPKANIDPTAKVGPFCVIGEAVTIGARTELVSHVSIAGETTVGEDCVVYPFCALGSPPQDLKWKGERTRLVIGSRNVMREHVTMHPGTGVGRQETRIGSDCYFMVGAHVAHDCILGDRIVLANSAQIAGYVVVGDNVIFGGLSGVHQHCRVGPHAFIGAMATVVNDVIPYGSVVGNHARLAGLNIVGLRRRNFSREQIHDLRAAYRMLFAEEGNFQERIEDTIQSFGSSKEVQEIIAFIRDGGSRALCMPRD
jgi:UDP-N-acetylglucosamine acyltransferase